MIRSVVLLVALLVLAFTPFSCQQDRFVVGSKKFTESVILGEIVTQLGASTGRPFTHLAELGGTQLVYQALRSGEIDVYVDYTGTIREEILAGTAASDQQIRETLAADGILMSQPLGFNNTYAIGMKKSRAQRLGIESISDFARHSQLRLGFSSEFMDRRDGWPQLRKHYGLAHQDVRGMDHDLAYRQLEAGGIDAVDAYTTDAKIARYEITLLADDRNYFPRYDAVLLYRADLARRAGDFAETLLAVEGSIDQQTMTDMNAQVELNGKSEAAAASKFLEEHLNVTSEVKEETVTAQIWRHTLEHLNLVRKSLLPAILVAIPLGVFAAKRPGIGQVILGAVGVVQTIPALALLVMLITPARYLGLSSVGMGSATAVAALFLYSLLPIVRNTYAGLHNIPKEYTESALALGLPPLARLRLVEIPLASRTILAGVKTAAVINVGFATLGALIGAGGYGQPILTGIRLDDTNLILQGAIPAAMLALMVQGFFDLSERFFVPKGLRLGDQR